MISNSLRNQSVEGMDAVATVTDPHICSVAYQAELIIYLEHQKMIINKCIASLLINY